MKMQKIKNKKVGVVAIVAIGIACGCFSLWNGMSQESSANKAVFDLTEDGGATLGGLESDPLVVGVLNEKVTEGMLNISMNSNPVFVDGVGNVMIVNKDTNTMPQVVEIYMEDDVLIYRSGAIPVGSKVEQGSLLVPLDAGDYKCVAYFNAVNGETGELSGRAGINVTVTVG